MKCYNACERERERERKKNKKNIATKDMSFGNNIKYIKNKVTQFKNLIFQHFISPFTM